MWGGADLPHSGAHSGGGLTLGDPPPSSLLFVKSWVSWLLERKGGEGGLLLSNTMLLKAGMSQPPHHSLPALQSISGPERPTPPHPTPPPEEWDRASSRKKDDGPLVFKLPQERPEWPRGLLCWRDRVEEDTPLHWPQSGCSSPEHRPHPQGRSQA